MYSLSSWVSAVTLVLAQRKVSVDGTGKARAGHHLAWEVCHSDRLFWSGVVSSHLASVKVLNDEQQTGLFMSKICCVQAETGVMGLQNVQRPQRTESDCSRCPL